MTTTIKFDDLEHTGQFSQEYVDGFVFMYMRANYHETDDEMDITVTGKHNLDFDRATEYIMGGYPAYTGPGPLADAGITNREQLEEYLTDATEIEPEPNSIHRYLAEVYISEQEVGGFERDRSFIDFVTFDDPEFIRGLYQAARMLDRRQDEMFFDTTTFTLTTLASIDSEPQAN